MNKEIKKCADENDVKGLRYIFVDCLDVDPTFEAYKEDYTYCKEIKGFFDGFEDMTPLRTDSSTWNEDYWIKLKVDLLKNFSEKRFLHMIEVAKIVKADKVRKLQEERQLSKEKAAKKVLKNDDNHEAIQVESVHSLSKSEEQKKQLEAAQEKCEREKRRQDDEIARETKMREERKRQFMANESGRNEQNVVGTNSSKKVLGIVVLGIVILLIIIGIVIK